MPQGPGVAGRKKKNPGGGEKTFYRQRQSNIDEELFDVIAGVEALAAGSTGAQPGKRREYG
jgi:F-type H+-transporting ATPase subunit gamma